jgi:hypothetical protein
LPIVATARSLQQLRPYSMTSSARASSVCGTSIPCDFRLEVDDQFKFCRLRNRNVLRLFALENFGDWEGEAAIQIHNIVCVTLQSAALDECAIGVHRGQPPFRNQSDQFGPIAEMLTFIGDKKRIRPILLHHLKARSHAASLKVDPHRVGIKETPARFAPSRTATPDNPGASQRAWDARKKTLDSFGTSSLRSSTHFS